MGNFYESMLSSGMGRKVLSTVGLPTPIDLHRYNPSQATFLEGNVLVGTAKNGELISDIVRNLGDSDANIFFPSAATSANEIVQAGSDHSVKVTQVEYVKGMAEKFNVVIFDASGIEDGAGLTQLYTFFNPIMRSLTPNARVLVLGRPHMKAKNGEKAAAMRALEGFTRSVSKEIGKKSSTSQVVYIEEGAEKQMDSTLRFLASAKSAYVAGQVVHVRRSNEVQYPDWHKPLAGKIALVTGASRGIGESIARTLSRDGATVLGLDIPPAEADLNKVMTKIGGECLLADISSKETPALIAAKLQEMGGADIVVHNAGITRDKTLANMPQHWWDMTIAINLSAEEHINNELFATNTINAGGSIICVSSMNGIAGQMGQTNYAASKAGVIGYVQYMADELVKRKITINAVAPGFIETAMTDAIPFMTREVGRRLNSLSQGGKPVDVAETIAFFANPASSGVTGNVVRVCGQSLVGA
jgi:3-oxoacyl-[acyl-carrier protein] reductase